MAMAHMQAESYAWKVLQIKQLSPAGVQQLSVDLDYLRKVPTES